MGGHQGSSRGSPARLRRSLSLQFDWISRHALRIAWREGEFCSSDEVSFRLIAFAPFHVFAIFCPEQMPVLRAIRAFSPVGSDFRRGERWRSEMAPNKKERDPANGSRAAKRSQATAHDDVEWVARGVGGGRTRDVGERPAVARVVATLGGSSGPRSRPGDRQRVANDQSTAGTNVPGPSP